ncbi:purine nucleoside phosphorylase isoform X2 [Eurytemora carolleeae]|uniref:purine nucleoside phosphorylase isoform X2 n=1 Tax=Eurytemora carolleeae TaxID=1294199 RepID=UPI000C792F16|nr:purine nucleoside phosphorylase isoform X2 [Eurytemora carolleeae]|eukprot:XP_023344677.1 purine nucleoside phosphorylase-like isoform X2 [Eurytemora affinis]
MADTSSIIENNLYDPISYDVVSVSAEYIKKRTTYRPEIGIICGSGLGGLAELVNKADIFPYEEIPNFPVSTVPGHVGRLLLGNLENVPVVIMQGRFHSYEGYELWKTAMPVRVMKLLGVKKIIVTNAGGGLNKAFQVGDIMVMKDHINLPGFSCQHPLRGPNDERFGPRFFPTNDLYCHEYRKLARKVGIELRLEGVIREGVYIMLGGPNYETVAELKMLREMGVDSVGMSTIPETIVAHHCGIKVFACSLITNMCIVEYGSGIETNHEEVMEVGHRRAEDLKKFVTKMVEKMSSI